MIEAGNPLININGSRLNGDISKAGFRKQSLDVGEQDGRCQAGLVQQSLPEQIGWQSAFAKHLGQDQLPARFEQLADLPQAFRRIALEGEHMIDNHLIKRFAGFVGEILPG